METFDSDGMQVLAIIWACVLGTIGLAVYWITQREPLVTVLLNSDICGAGFVGHFQARGLHAAAAHAKRCGWPDLEHDLRSLAGSRPGRYYLTGSDATVLVGDVTPEQLRGMARQGEL